MISEVDLKAWEMSNTAIKLYDAPRDSVVCPIEDTNLVVNFLHVDGMFSYCSSIRTQEIVHIAAWTDVFVWYKKPQL